MSPKIDIHHIILNERLKETCKLDATAYPHNISLVQPNYWFGQKNEYDKLPKSCLNATTYQKHV